MRPWLFPLLFLASTVLPAQEFPPVVDARGVLHGATFQSLTAPPFAGRPGGVAPGALFRLFGSHLGPSELTVGTSPFGLRLPDVPGGTEVRVRSIGTGKLAQARMVFVQDNQVAAILPRDFPLGDAEVTVWTGAGISDPVTVPVVFSYPGLFTLTQNGVGRAVIQNVEDDGRLTINGLTQSAKPGQYITLWATGLGEARAEDVRVFFGEDFYPADFAGPAPGFPGLDQINVRIPEDVVVRGCYARLVVAGDGLGSGPASIAISDEGGACDHPWGLSAERMAEIEAGDRATRLSINLSDLTSAISRTQLPPFELESSIGGSAYALDELLLEVQATAADRLALAYQPPFCFVSGGTFDAGSPPPGRPPPPASTVPPEQTFAGSPWVVTGPQGQTVSLASAATPGNLGLIGVQSRESGFLAPGEWTVSIPGGSEIGPTDFAMQMPALPEIDAPSVLRRGEDFELSWPPEQATPLDEVRITVRFWQPLPDRPGNFRTDGITCELAPGTTRFVVPLSRIEGPLPDAVEGEVSVSLTRPQPSYGGAAVDFIDARGSIGHSWSIPLE